MALRNELASSIVTGPRAVGANCEDNLPASARAKSNIELTSRSNLRAFRYTIETEDACDLVSVVSSISDFTGPSINVSGVRSS